MTIPLQEVEIALQRKEHRLAEHKKKHKKKQELVQAIPDLQKERLHMATSINSVPGVEQKPTLVAWILFDTTTDKKYIKMNPADGSLAIFDNEEAAMAAKKLHYGTDYKRCEYYSDPQSVPDAVVMPLFAGALEGLLGIVQESTGVTGWHLNGDVAGWGEFEEVEIAEEALALYRKQGGEL